MTIANIAAGGSWNGTVGSGGMAPAESATIRGSGWTGKAIGNWDMYPYFRLTDNLQINVICDTGDSGFIQEVEFYCEGTSVTVTQQTIDPVSGSIGYAVNLNLLGFSRDGDAQLYAYIRPVNGYERRIGPLDFVVIGTGVSTITPDERYVDSANGNDSWNGQSPTFTGGSTGPWKSILKAALTSPSGANVTVAAGTYLEDSNNGTVNSVDRTLHFQRAVGTALGDVKISRSARVIGAGGTSGSIWRTRCTKVLFDGFYIDASKMSQIDNTLTVFKNCVIEDPSGADGPKDGDGKPIGYFIPTEAGQILFRDALGQFNALIDSVCTNYISTGCRLIKNSVLNVSADALFFTNSLTSNGTVIVNSVAHQDSQMFIRCCMDEFLAVATKSYDSVTQRTTITWTTTPGAGTVSSTGTTATTSVAHGLRTGDTIRITSGSQANEIRLLDGIPSPTTMLLRTAFSVDQTAVTWEKVPTISPVSAGGQAYQGCWFLDGALENVDGPPGPGGYQNGWPIYLQTMPGIGATAGSAPPTTVLAGDASAAVAGDTARSWIIFHADSFQVARASTTGAPENIENVIAQRCLFRGQNFQPMLLQAGEVVGSGTISTSGTTLTCSTAHNLAKYDFVVLTSGSQINEYRLVVSVGSSTTATLANAFSVNQSGASWHKAKTLKDVSVQNCVFDHYGSDVEVNQWQNGEEHVVMRQCTHVGTGLVLRNTPPQFGLSNSVLVDSVFGYNPSVAGSQSVTSDAAGPGFPNASLGLTVDNNHFMAGTVRGTNGTGPSVVTLDSDYRATGGTLTNTIPSPKILWDYYGTPLRNDGTDFVGAVQPPPTPDLSVAGTANGGTYDFGEVMIGVSNSHQFTITNVGTAPCTIGTAAISGAGWSISGIDDPSGITLPIDGATTITVIGNFPAPGPRAGILTIPSDDPDSPYEVHLVATVDDLYIYSHDQLTSIGTAESLTVPTGCDFAYLQAVSHDIYFTRDASSPSSTNGLVLIAGHDPIRVNGNLLDLRFLEVASGAVLDVCFRTDRANV